MNATHSNIVAALRGRTTRKVGNNTYAEKHEDGSVTIRLHQTHILRVLVSGTVVVDTKGWRTVTTKQRLNEWLKDGYAIGQTAGVWYWYHYDEKEGMQKVGPFSDGDTIGPRGALIMRAEPDAPQKAKELAKQVNQYAILCSTKLPLAEPGPGDCLYCQITAKDAKLPATWGAEHIISHMNEGYVVPSLVYSALLENNATPLVISITFGKGTASMLAFAREVVRRSVRRYLKRRLQLAGN